MSWQRNASKSALGGLPRGGDARAEALTTNRSAPGEEDGNMFEHLIEGKKKQVFCKDPQGALIFPGFSAERPGRGQAGLTSRDQVIQDCVHYAAGCVFYLHDNEGPGKFVF